MYLLERFDVIKLQKKGDHSMIHRPIISISINDDALDRFENKRYKIQIGNSHNEFYNKYLQCYPYIEYSGFIITKGIKFLRKCTISHIERFKKGLLLKEPVLKGISIDRVNIYILIQKNEISSRHEILDFD